MNIFPFTEKKSVVYLCVLFYFLFLCVLFSQTNSSFVGFGFGFLWLISVWTKNIVLCIAGSFLLTCLMLLVVQLKKKEGFSYMKEGRCNPVCSTQNEMISSANTELHTTIDSLTKKNAELTSKNDGLEKDKTNLQTEVSGLTTEVGGLRTQTNNLNTDIGNLTASKERYRVLVEDIERISSS